MPRQVLSAPRASTWWPQGEDSKGAPDAPCGKRTRDTGNPLFAYDDSPIEGTSYSAALASGVAALIIAARQPNCVLDPEASDRRCSTPPRP